MIDVRLQIAGGAIQDVYKTYGFIYQSADHRLAPPTRGFEKTTYAEQEGENIDPRTVDDAFDYTVRFVILAPNKNYESANTKIAEFNSLMYDKKADSDIKTFKEFTFYNDYKRVKIVGYPEPIAEAKEFWRDKFGNVHDAVQVELKIHVAEPKKCDFDMYVENNENSGGGGGGGG